MFIVKFILRLTCHKLIRITNNAGIMLVLLLQFLYTINQQCITRLRNVSAVVGVEAELEELSVDVACHSEDRIVSQWREISADERLELRERMDEIFRPLGFETRLVVVRRAN